MQTQLALYLQLEKDKRFKPKGCDFDLNAPGNNNNYLTNHWHLLGASTKKELNIECYTFVL